MTLDMSALPQPKYNQIKHHVQDLFPYKHGKIQQDGEKQDDRENNAWFCLYLVDFMDFSGLGAIKRPNYSSGKQGLRPVEVKALFPYRYGPLEQPPRHNEPERENNTWHNYFQKVYWQCLSFVIYSLTKKRRKSTFSPARILHLPTGYTKKIPPSFFCEGSGISLLFSIWRQKQRREVYV